MNRLNAPDMLLFVSPADSDMKEKENARWSGTRENTGVENVAASLNSYENTLYLVDEKVVDSWYNILFQGFCRCFAAGKAGDSTPLAFRELK